VAAEGRAIGPGACLFTLSRWVDWTFACLLSRPEHARRRLQRNVDEHRIIMCGCRCLGYRLGINSPQVGVGDSPSPARVRRVTGHKTESVYRRYAIFASQDLADGVPTLARLDGVRGTIGGQRPEQEASGASGGQRGDTCER